MQTTHDVSFSLPSFTQSSSSGSDRSRKRRADFDNDVVSADVSHHISQQSTTQSTQPYQKVSKPALRWLRQRMIEYDEPKGRQPNPSGARTLRDISLLQIAKYSEDLTLESFSTLPWRLAKDVWLCLERESAASIYIWRIYVKLFGSEKDLPRTIRDCAFSHSIPENELGSFPQALSPPSCPWLTILSLFQVNLDHSVWMQLGRMTNLSLLLISDPLQVGNFDDSVLRAWSINARDEEAFPALNILMLDRIKLASPQCFQNLALWPVLRVANVNVVGNLVEVSMPLGARLAAIDKYWRRSSDLISTLQETSRKENPCLRAYLYQYHRSLQRSLESQNPSLATASAMPVLNARVNSDRNSGTQQRLLWFERRNDRPSQSIAVADSMLEPATRSFKRPQLRMDRRQDFASMLGLTKE